MSEVELQHWMRIAAARGGFAAAAQTEQLLQQFAAKPQALQHKAEVGKKALCCMVVGEAFCLCMLVLITTSSRLWGRYEYKNP